MQSKRVSVDTVPDKKVQQKMTWEELQQQIQSIQEPDQNAGKAAQAHWDGIAKPLDGLGQLEKMIIQIAAIMGTADIEISRRAVIAMCADNGVVAEGVSQTSQEVTAIVSANMAAGISSVCRMGKKANVDVIPVNIGIHDAVEAKGLLNRNIARGTRDFLVEPAMTQEEVLAAIACGMEIVQEQKKEGYQILATGEMGIGNTTTSSALASVLLGLPVEMVTGKGAGLSREGIARKKQVIAAAIAKYDLKKEEPMRALACVGGLDIAGLTGVFLGGALYHVPVVIDGVIAAVAALLAARMAPGAEKYMLPSHMSMEPATHAIMQELKLHPVIDADLALGEGTGAVLLFPMLDMALEVYHENTTFDEIHVGQYERFS